MTRYRGREIDPIALWSEYVDFPPRVDERGPFLPLVRCPNPDHDTLKRHFQINVEQALVHCFAGCGISGSWETAIMRIEGVGRAEARRRILRHSRVSIPGAEVSHQRSRKNSKRPAEIVRPDLSRFSYLPQTALEYLTHRGISDESISRWELGWNPETLRITIPVRDLDGRLAFVIERSVTEKDWPKYLYPEDAERSAFLFGAGQIDPRVIRSRGMAVTEGSLDAIVLAQHEILPVPVAILGSYPSDRQVEIINRLRPSRVYSFFDFDAAGFLNTIRLRKQITRIPIFVCRYPKGGPTDPAAMSRKEAHRSVEKAVPFVKFQTRVRALKGAKSGT